MKTIRKSDKIMFVLFFMLVIVLSPLTFAKETSDDSFGKILADYQLITGFNGDLMTEKHISRVEMIAIISKLYAAEFKDYTPPTVATFDDVKTTHWGYKYVEFAFNKGITSGKSANIFGVSDSVNYNQVSIFLIKALGFDLKGIQYKTAASEIADAYGLKPLIPTENNQILKRGNVFELLVKALLMEDVYGVLGIESLTQSTVLKETYISRSEAVINTPVALYIGSGIFNIYYANGDLYTGEFDGSSPKGNGILKFADGNLYIGQFDKGKLQGRGMLQGHGIFIWSEGDYYEGEWVNDSYNGLGMYTFIDGSYQYGEWVNDLLVKSTDEVTPEQIKAGTAVASKNYVVHLIGSDGLPLNGISLRAIDETNEVSYNLISDSNGNVEIPKIGEFAIVSLTLGENSAYQFSISSNTYMVTTVGIYKKGVTYELFK